MWDLVNHTPFAVDGALARDRRGAEFWCSAVVATFATEGHQPCRHVPGDTVRLVSEFAGPDGTEMHHDADLTPFRERADILLAGDAVAPDARPVERIEIGIHLGKLSRRLEARAPSWLVKGRWGWQREQGDAVARVATGWQMALGGCDPFSEMPQEFCADNPVGKGWTRNFGRAARGDRLEMPQLCRPLEQVDPRQPLPDPAGLGPVHPAWHARSRHAGSYDQAWRDGPAPLPPEDFDARFYQAAPDEQVYPGDLVGGEPVSITGMHEDGPWSFRLPQIVLSQDCRIAGKTDSTRLRLVSVQLDAAAGRLRMVWNGATRCTGREHRLERSTIRMVQMSGVAT